MAARIIDGRAIALEVRAGVASDVEILRRRGITPGLVAVLVGDDAGSQVYVEAKRKAAEAAGIDSQIRRLPAGATRTQLLEVIASLNEDPRVHGAILQLPLPRGLDPIEAQEALDPAKDVDGLHPQNVGLLTLGRARFTPCTALGVEVLLEKSNIETQGAHVVVIGRSNLVGRPLSILLSQKTRLSNATVTLCHTGTVDLAMHTRQGDIVVAASGVPKAVTADMIKPGATVIDVGISRTPTGLIGDVDFENVAKLAGAITPVPGGVGPMTVAMLLANTVKAAQSP